MNIISLLATKKPISTRHFQQKFAEVRDDDHAYEVVNQGQSVGVFLPEHIWKSLMEDLIAKEYKPEKSCCCHKPTAHNFLKGEDFLNNF